MTDCLVKLQEENAQDGWPSVVPHHYIKSLGAWLRTGIKQKYLHGGYWEVWRDYYGSYSLIVSNREWLKLVYLNNKSIYCKCLILHRHDVAKGANSKVLVNISFSVFFAPASSCKCDVSTGLTPDWEDTQRPFVYQLVG